MRATAAADTVTASKTAKYPELAKTRHFVPIVIETCGA